MAYYIGSVEFDDLQGNIILPTPMHDAESRTGQDGVVVFSTGKRGQEFEMTSEFHLNTYAGAVALMADYYVYPSITPRNIIRGTEDYSASDFRFVVLGVNVEIQSKVSWQGLRSSGRVNVSPAHCVTARWRMIAVEV
jgi:hypothetical protein